MRAYFQKHVIVNSWCRCVKWNKEVGGKPNSYHVKAMAADFWLPSVPAGTVADYLETKYPDAYGIGRYPGFTHIDVRADRARWQEEKDGNI